MKAPICAALVGLVWAILSTGNFTQAGKEPNPGEDRLPVGFTVVPVNTGHLVPTIAGAAHAKILGWEPFTFSGSPLEDIVNYSSGFRGWLRDGKKALIEAADAQSQPTQYIVEQTQAVNPKWKIVGRPSEKIKGVPYATQIVYKKNLSDVEKFILYIGVANNNREIQLVNNNGDPLISKPFRVGNHSCEVSPDGQYLACEAINGDSCNGILLLTVNDFKRAGCARSSVDVAVDGWAISWSPNSAGFTYYAHHGDTYEHCNTNGIAFLAHITVRDLIDGKNGRIVLCKKAGVLQCDSGVPTAFLPAQFCGGTGKKYECQKLGGLGVGSETPQWSANSNKLYFSAVKETEPCPKRRMLGVVNVSWNKDSIPTFGAFTPLVPKVQCATGYPAVSPSGQRVAFLSTVGDDEDCHNTDTKSQLFVYDYKSGKVTSLAHQTMYNEVYAPHWRPY